MAEYLPTMRIKGLGDASRDLRALSDAFPRGLQPLMKDLAGGFAPRARELYVQRYRAGPHERSIRATASQRSAKLVFGGTAATGDEIYGQEFGSERYPQFRPFSGSMAGGSRGHFFYPAIREQLEDIDDRFEKHIQGPLRAAFPVGGAL